MIKQSVKIVIYFLAFSCNAQQNLALNSSFELYSECPQGDCEMFYSSGFPADNWQILYGTPDYYNICGIGCWNLYTAWGGAGDAEDGNGYIGLILRGNTIQPSNVREYLKSPLAFPLKTGNRYYGTFWVMLNDSARFATKNIGIAFFSNNIIISSPSELLSVQTQLDNNNSFFLEEKTKWTIVTDTFIANDDYSFLVIGNFISDEEMEIKYLPNNGIVDTTTYWQNRIYYYIDNVSIVEDTSYHPIGIEEEQLERIKLAYQGGNLLLQGLLFQNRETELFLYSYDGKQVGSFTLPKGNNSIPLKLPQGIYLYSLKIGEQALKRGKIWVGGE